MRAVTVRDIGSDLAIAIAPSHEDISARAYEVYMERAVGEGTQLGDWLRAERELLEERLQVTSFPTTRRLAITHDLASK